MSDVYDEQKAPRAAALLFAPGGGRGLSRRAGTGGAARRCSRQTRNPWNAILSWWTRPHLLAIWKDLPGRAPWGVRFHGLRFVRLVCLRAAHRLAVSDAPPVATFFGPCGTVPHPRRLSRALLLMSLFSLAPSGCTLVRDHQALRRVDRGEIFLESQDLEAALVEFQAAAELAPQMAVVHSKMGVIYQRLGEYQQAIDCFIEAIRQNPFSFSDTLRLAQLYHFTGRIRDAVQAYLHAVELEPDSFDLHLNLGTCYQQYGDFALATEQFQKAIDIDPNRAHAYVNLGVALDAQQRHYAAISAYKEALERDDHQPQVLVNLAQTYMNQDRLKMGRQALELALRMDQKLCIAHEAMGYCLFRMREFEQAKHAYVQALACDQHLPRTHAGLGSVHMLHYMEDKSRTDLRDKGLEHWHRSLELNPEQPRIRKLLARYKPRREDPIEVLLDDHPVR